METSQPTSPQGEEIVPESPVFFTTLAPELRNKIYELLLKGRGEVVWHPRYFHSVLASLRLVNRQISSEAHSMYFSLNRLRVPNGTLEQDFPFGLFPTICKLKWRHMAVMTFIGLSTRDGGKIPNSPREENLCLDLGFYQRLNLMELTFVLGAGCKSLETLTIEVSKLCFIPFELYAPDRALGPQMVLLIKYLRSLFELPAFRELVLVQKQDVKLDWVAGKLLEGIQWNGKIVIKQG